MTDLYRYYDDQGELLYVGISCDWTSRDAAHRFSSPWRQQATKVTIGHYPDRQSARGAELAAIKTENPRFNTAHTLQEQTGRKASHQIVLPVSEDTYQRLKEAADADRRPQTQLVRKILEDWLDR